ncbi:hypothetical protein SDC9_192087 [bioreactor metagenome]|uniref:Uncharacterized protein n=1 Tax=bioreactor metagenome TaxID=1076179 RepID=A0A645I197_9ZZZZ
MDRVPDFRLQSDSLFVQLHGKTRLEFRVLFAAHWNKIGHLLPCRSGQRCVNAAVVPLKRHAGRAARRRDVSDPRAVPQCGDVRFAHIVDAAEPELLPVSRVPLPIQKFPSGHRFDDAGIGGRFFAVSFVDPEKHDPPGLAFKHRRRLRTVRKGPRAERRHLSPEEIGCHPQRVSLLTRLIIGLGVKQA